MKADMLTVYGIKALLDLLLEYPTLIKRPVFVTDEIVAVGFNPKDLAEL